MTKRNILFVDDEQAILDGIRTMMHSKRKQWKCHFATSGAEGLELLAQTSFDVVISDMRMPGMDGADFLGEVADRQPGAIRMILSGYSEVPALLKSAKIAHQFLSKPCHSRKLTDTIQRVIDLGDILRNEGVRQVVSRLDTLPAIPDLFARITEELESPEPNLKLVGNMVERDAGISTTLLKVVNSSFFGFYENVNSPSRAVTLLGIEAVKGLILGVHFFSEVDGSAFSGYSVEKLWDHSLQTGYFAKIIASLESKDKTFIDSCFLGGILHDVGKMVFVMKMNPVYTPVLDCVKRWGGPIHLCERKELGVTHAKVGAYLLGLWGFKREVVEAVDGHHLPELTGDKLTPAMVIHVANTIQHNIKRTSKEYTFSSINEEYLAELGLEDRLEVWIEACNEKWSEHEE